MQGWRKDKEKGKGKEKDIQSEGLNRLYSSPTSRIISPRIIKLAAAMKVGEMIVVLYHVKAEKKWKENE